MNMYSSDLLSIASAALLDTPSLNALAITSERFLYGTAAQQ